MCAFPTCFVCRTAPFSSSRRMIVWTVVYAGRPASGNLSWISLIDALPNCHSASIISISNRVSLIACLRTISSSSATTDEAYPTTCVVDCQACGRENGERENMAGLRLQACNFLRFCVHGNNAGWSCGTIRIFRFLFEIFFGQSGRVRLDCGHGIRYLFSLTYCYATPKTNEKRMEFKL